MTIVYNVTHDIDHGSISNDHVFISVYVGPILVSFTYNQVKTGLVCASTRYVPSSYKNNT